MRILAIMWAVGATIAISGGREVLASAYIISATILVVAWNLLETKE